MGRLSSGITSASEIEKASDAFRQYLESTSKARLTRKSSKILNIIFSRVEAHGGYVFAMYNTYDSAVC